MRTALAWRNLTSSRSKLLLSATGVGFAVLLMFMQIGFRNALFDSNVEMINLFDADIIMLSPARYNLSSERRFRLHWLQRAEATEGVQAVSALRTERNTASVKVEGHKSRTIRVLAIDPDPQFFMQRELAEKLEQADQEQGVLVDRRSKVAYGFAVNDNEKLRAQHVELNGNNIQLVDTFTLGTDFANDGTLLMSNRQYPSLFPFRSPTRDPMDLVDIGLIKLDPGPTQSRSCRNWQH